MILEHTTFKDYPTLMSINVKPLRCSWHDTVPQHPLQQVLLFEAVRAVDPTLHQHRLEIAQSWKLVSVAVENQELESTVCRGRPGFSMWKACKSQSKPNFEHSPRARKMNLMCIHTCAGADCDQQSIQFSAGPVFDN